MHFTTEYSLSFWGKDGAKAPYLVGRCLFTWIDFQMSTMVYSRKLGNYSYLKVIKFFLLRKSI